MTIHNLLFYLNLNDKKKTKEFFKRRTRTVSLFVPLNLHASSSLVFFIKWSLLYYFDVNFVYNYLLLSKLATKHTFQEYVEKNVMRKKKQKLLYKESKVKGDQNVLYMKIIWDMKVYLSFHKILAFKHIQETVRLIIVSFSQTNNATSEM